MRILNEFLKKRAIRGYIYKVTPVLVRGFAPQEEYTVPQIEASIRKAGESARYMPYAIALYRYEQSHRTVSLYRIDQRILDEMRAEISDWFFGGEAYSAADVIKLATPRAWRGGHIRDDLSNRMGMTSRY